MNLKIISNIFIVNPCGKNIYALYTSDNNKKEIYPDYNGSIINPFVGCIEVKGNIFQFVSYGIDLKPYSKVKFNTIEELKDLVSTYLLYFRNNGINSDCCNPQFRDIYKCECAFYQFFKNNTNIPFTDKSNKIQFRNITISAMYDISSNQLSDKYTIVFHYKDGGFTSKECATPKDVFVLLKSFMELLLLYDVTESICNLRKISASEIDNNYTFDGDMIQQVDLQTLSIKQVGALKDDIIKKLEDKINFLKNK